MLPRSQDAAAPDAAGLQDKALNLRESVNSSRARMSAQSERLERLRREIAELRALVEKTPVPAPAAATPITSPAPALVAAPARSPRVASVPFAKEAAPVSAAATASFGTGAGWDAWKPVPYVAIFFLAAGMQIRATRKTPAPVEASLPGISAELPAPAPALDDGGADEALLLAHDWRLPGDERSLSERLGADGNPPGSAPEWTAERTGDRTYRVTFRASGSDLGYDFDVDLAARRVDPTPATAELISPRLVSRR